MSRVRAAAAAAAMGFWYAPVMPAVPTGLLDSNWALGLAIACERRLQFGVDLVFTYGPTGCLATWQYWPATYGASLVFWAGIGALAAWLAVSAARSAREAWAGLLAIAWLGLVPDTGLLALPLAFTVHGLRSRAWTPAAWFAIVWMAPVALAKLTLLPVCGLAVAGGALLRRRLSHVAPALLLFGVAVLTTWLLAGQALDALLPFLRNGAEVSRGYPQAMAWPGGRPGLELASFVLSIAVTAAAVSLVALLALGRPAGAAASWRADAGRWLFLLPVLLLVVRHATVRGDPGHLLIGFSLIGAIGLLVSGEFGAARRWLFALVMLCAVSTAVMAQVAQLDRAGGAIAARLSAAWRGLQSFALLRDPRTELDAALAAVRARFTDPVVQRAVGPRRFDVLGHDQHLALGRDANRWAPRPVLQGYSAYTLRLSALNAAYLAGDQAPDRLLVQVQTIDRRLPMFDDALAWPVVRQWYAVQERTATHLLLSRRPTAKAIAPRAAAGAHRSADWMQVPSAAGTTVYGTVAVERSLLDRARSVLWKPPIWFIELRVAGNAEPQRFRLVPEIAAAGFVLSPLIQRNDELAGWLAGEPLPTATVTHLRITDEYGRPVTATTSFETDQ